MSWLKLLAEKRVTLEPTSREEMENLRAIVARSLKDVEAVGLSADTRFILAYDAARTLSLLVVRSAGYRPRSAAGHYNTFLALEVADSAFAAASAYFDGCRMKRNECEYDYAGAVTETEAGALLETVRQFAIDTAVWVKRHHPHLA